MRGHVYRRGETWTYVVDIGHDASGRRRQTSKGGFPTKKDAQAALNVALNSLQQGTFVEPTAITVEHFLRDRWLPAARGTIRPTTYSSRPQPGQCAPDSRHAPPGATRCAAVAADRPEPGRCR